MVNEELVDLIAEAIYRHLHDGDKVSAKDYTLLTEEERNYYLAIAHDVMCVYDDYFDAELDLDVDEDFEEDDLYADEEDRAIDEEDIDDGYGEHLFWD